MKRTCTACHCHPSARTRERRCLLCSLLHTLLRGDLCACSLDIVPSFVCSVLFCERPVFAISGCKGDNLNPTTWSTKTRNETKRRASLLSVFRPAHAILQSDVQAVATFGDFYRPEETDRNDIIEVRILIQSCAHLRS
jgi:hypothetical protein